MRVIYRDFRDNGTLDGDSIDVVTDALLTCLNARTSAGRALESRVERLRRFPVRTDALLTRYAGDKFERSQHAYRTQRAQIHIQVYALRERRDDPAPKHTHPATLYYLLLYYTKYTHAT